MAVGNKNPNPWHLLQPFSKLLHLLQDIPLDNEHSKNFLFKMTECNGSFALITFSHKELAVNIVTYNTSHAHIKHLNSLKFGFFTWVMLGTSARHSLWCTSHMRCCMSQPPALVVLKYNLTFLAQQLEECCLP